MRLLHTMLRVGELDRSIAFYCDVLGMKLLRRQDYPEGKFTLAFVGYQDERDGAVIELTHNWDTGRYDLGNGYGHIALEVRSEEHTSELQSLMRISYAVFFLKKQQHQNPVLT